MRAAHPFERLDFQFKGTCRSWVAVVEARGSIEIRTLCRIENNATSVWPLANAAIDLDQAGRSRPAVKNLLARDYGIRDCTDCLGGDLDACGNDRDSSVGNCNDRTP